jgi:hypothetical protein
VALQNISVQKSVSFPEVSQNTNKSVIDEAFYIANLDLTDKEENYIISNNLFILITLVFSCLFVYFLKYSFNLKNINIFFVLICSSLIFVTIFPPWQINQTNNYINRNGSISFDRVVKKGPYKLIFDPPESTSRNQYYSIDYQRITMQYIALLIPMAFVIYLKKTKPKE